MIRFLRDMGLRYALFRFWHEIQVRTGLLILRFPVSGKNSPHFSKDEWLRQSIHFALGPALLNLERNPALQGVQERVEHIWQNRFLFFHDKWHSVSDWHTNPENGFTYNKTMHWSRIPTLSRQAGDIKYVWEKSRFCFLYDLIRFDLHFQVDQSGVVFSFINDWIEKNPVNRGPNWICGQEIALRVLNWTFALHYYKSSDTLTDELFSKILNSIRQQMLHVEQNMNFSRAVVRNNHALTETLALYVIGWCFPVFPESSRWKQNGKQWFEQEIAYQIYDDGTFLQFSMNYHRVAVQLLTLAIDMARLNEEKWNDVVYERAEKSLHFLRSCQDNVTGWLPNYGNNDGALLFPLTEQHFRDFRPQLEALSRSLQIMELRPAPLSFFKNGGYYIFRDENTMTFLRCGAYKNRPFQADNLHLDIWANGMNIMRDAGSYSYNTDEKWTEYFSGTASHNTVMLGDFDQIKKGPRFMWYNWIKNAKGSVKQDTDSFQIDAEFEGFYQLGKGIKHCRRVVKSKNTQHWIVEDRIDNRPNHLPMHQIWHPHPEFFEHYQIMAEDNEGSKLDYIETEGWYSETYMKKVACRRLVFSSFGNYIKTIIKEKQSLQNPCTFS
ncbi:heparinase II/III family protein [Dyadobacter chenwenxiniae]|uniref:Heparinase II/III family protein n=1 Tax=Dyadobacter chenwenxiniae TaxID=2906456 RepID=A0A9X1TED3_9BACT|nr:alginate lyase family protein [Dyadobacter chenwenxiniae]MCF0061992.1 heparinase II/III family protein [Dyadobacter chenwenxiniae]UON81803.1 heparinase II/III family protein [Dyadobacter chenwenxiniae]